MTERMTSTAVQKFNAAVFRKAVQWGVVSQSEMFHRCELEMEQKLKHWEWHEGKHVGGPYFYVPAWMRPPIK